MDGQKATIIISLILAAVILFNLALYWWVKSRKPNKSGEIAMISRAFKRARNPWESENNKLAELASTVAALQNQQSDENPTNSE